MPSVADESKQGTGSIDATTDGQKKPTVLETHGYYLGKTVGTGSYATVRVAHSERHEGDVAVKIVSKFSAPADYLKKFLPREIEVVKGLRHPNLIRFLQAIETTHRVYIVMEYAHNGSLLDVIRKDSYIDEARARKWFRQLVDAVDYCHERGVVHRDIKCENMLMDIAYNMKLSDFGFARGHLKPKNGVLPLSETFCGSYAYASPEILRGVPYAPQLADIWSMGVVLFAMVFGRLPFDDGNYRELIKIAETGIRPEESRKGLFLLKIFGMFLPDRNKLQKKGLLKTEEYSLTGLIKTEEHSLSGLYNTEDNSQVSSKVMFPKSPRVSNQCKNLINKVLSPLKQRTKIENIREDEWYQTVEPGTSKEAEPEAPPINLDATVEEVMIDQKGGKGK